MVFIHFLAHDLSQTIRDLPGSCSKGFIAAKLPILTIRAAYR